MMEVNKIFHGYWQSYISGSLYSFVVVGSSEEVARDIIYQRIDEFGLERTKEDDEWAIIEFEELKGTSGVQLVEV